MHSADKSAQPAARVKPRVSFSPELLAYMQRKNYDYVAAELLSPMGATADSTELYTRFVRAKEAEKLLAEGWRLFTADGPADGQPAPADCATPQPGLLVGRGVEYDQQIKLGIRSFLGLKDIKTQGVHAFKL